VLQRVVDCRVIRNHSRARFLLDQAGGPIDQQLSLTGIFEGMGLELLAGLPLAE
jgi:hypothetical protein